MMNRPALSIAALSFCFACTGPGPFAEMPDMTSPPASDAAAPTDAAVDASADMSAADMAVAPKCSPATCGGCCAGDICQPGVTVSFCGVKGQVCASCSPTSSCQGDGSCAPDLSGLYDIMPGSGSVSARKPSGDCWDFPCGAPDPYLYVGISQTGVQSDTYSPYFSSVFTASYDDLKRGVSVAMWDEDVSDDDWIGSGKLVVSDADLRARRDVVVMLGSSASVTFKIAKRP